MFTAYAGLSLQRSTNSRYTATPGATTVPRASRYDRSQHDGRDITEPSATVGFNMGRET